MGLFDWFAADLACRACGARTGPDCGTGAQTKLHPRPRQNYLRVGDELPVTPDSAEDARYTALGPSPDGDIRILQHWDCRSCDDSTQWLEVVVRDGRILSIESVAFDAALLAAAHYIEDETLLTSVARFPETPPMLNDPKEALRLLRASLAKSP